MWKIPKSEKIPRSGKIWKSEKISRSEKIPKSEKILRSGKIWKSEKISRSEKIPKSQKIPISEKIPRSEKRPQWPGKIFQIDPTYAFYEFSPHNMRRWWISKHADCSKSSIYFFRDDFRFFWDDFRFFHSYSDILTFAVIRIFQKNYNFFLELDKI